MLQPNESARIRYAHHEDPTTIQPIAKFTAIERTNGHERAMIEPKSSPPIENAGMSRVADWTIILNYFI